MKKIILTFLAVLAFSSSLHAQQEIIVMIIWKNQSANGVVGAPLPGPISPTPTGWEWRMAGYVQNATTFAWDVIDCRARTLNNDSLETIQNKILAACKAQSALQGFQNVNVAIVEPMQIMTGF